MVLHFTVEAMNLPLLTMDPLSLSDGASTRYLHYW